MAEPVPAHALRIIVGVAVEAAVTAGVVGADVGPEEAGAGGAGSGGFRNLQMDMEGFLQDGLGKAAVRIDAGSCKGGAFAAEVDLHMVLLRRFREGRDEGLLLLWCDAADARKVPHRFLIEVDKADDALTGVSMQRPGHLPECADVKIYRVVFADKDRVIAPYHRILPHRFGQAPEGLQYLRGGRNMRLDVAPIGCDGHVPELPVRFQQILVCEHGKRVLGAEGQNVHDGRIEAVAGDKRRVIGIADEAESFPQAVRKPFAVEGGDICSASGVQYHSYTPCRAFCGTRGRNVRIGISHIRALMPPF